jgi:hypothetical protein
MTYIQENTSTIARKEASQIGENVPFWDDATDANCTQNTSLGKPVETTQARNLRAKQYRLSDKQIALFCALYPVHIPNKDDALTEIGANSAYRAHANEIIEQYKLTEKRGDR